MSTKRVWPSTRAWPVIGHMPEMIREGLIPFMEKAWREVGDCYEFRVAGECIKIVVHPDQVAELLLTHRHKYDKGASYDQLRRMVGQGLLTSEGDLWRRQRRIIQPSFNRDTVRNFGDRMVEKAHAMLERWTVKHDTVFDVHAELMRLTLDVLSHTLFELDLSNEQSITTGEFSEALGVAAARVTAVIEAPRWLPTPGNRRLERAMALIEGVVSRIIEARRRSGEDRDDLLGALLRGRTEDGGAIDDELLRDEVLTMFLAGQETTAVGLTWTLWLISQHPEVQARLLAEVDAAVGDRPPTMADLPKLGYVKQVLNESMRVISPIWASARNCVEADTLGDRYPVEVGERVMNIVWLTHKHPEFWPDPERFDPDRFAPERIAKQHKFAFMPFNEGPRKCVGEHFAMMESILVLTCLFQRHTLAAVPGFVPEMDFQLTTRPRHGLPMRLQPRA